MRKLFILSFFVLIHTITNAQTGVLSGKIITKKNIPISSAIVQLNNTNYKTTTDSDGRFKLKNIKAGAYVLKVNFLGYKIILKAVNINANKTTVLPVITLTQNQEKLEEVVVNGHTNKFYTKESSYVSKMPLKDLENPQVYNTVSSALLKEQVVTNFSDALKNVPGIDRLWESTGRGNDGAGYFALRGFSVQPTMVNGMPGLTNGSPDPANIESIQVIKGPSGTLYGSSLISFGGLININTKKPFFGTGGNISYTGGTYGLNRITADYNTTINKDKTAAIRINTAYHNQNSFQDAGFKKSFFFAPSFTYKANNKLSFNINTSFYSGKNTNPTMLFLDRGAKLRVHNIKELNYNNHKSYTSNDLYIKNPTYSLQGIMKYKIDDSWTSQTVISRSNAKSNGYYSYLYETTQYTPVTNGVVFSRYISKQNSETLGTDIQQNFIGNFKIGSIKNKMIAGLDYFSKTIINNNSGYVANGNIYIGNDLAFFNQNVLKITDKTKYTDDTGVLSQAGTNALLTKSKINPSKTNQEIYSAYASDVMYFLPQLSAMASLRIDRFSNNDYHQVALSPKFGLVYQPILNKMSLFANYMNGFSNVAPVSIATKTLTFNPEHANQLEFGTKINLFKNKVAATLSYYDIKVKNKVIQVSPTEYNQNGVQNSKGFEASIIANPIKGLNIVTGYSYNDSKMVQGDADFKGKRPEQAGPQNLANLWASYKFNQGKLAKFGLGFGGNYASKNKIFNRNIAGTFTVPAYTVLNSTIFYDVKDFRIALKLNNITNKSYYKGWSTINPQNKRVFSANFTYKF